MNTTSGMLGQLSFGCGGGSFDKASSTGQMNVATSTGSEKEHNRIYQSKY